jgi:hypothetical protein
MRGNNDEDDEDDGGGGKSQKAKILIPAGRITFSTAPEFH